MAAERCIAHCLPVRKIAALDHEVLDDTMEDGALVAISLRVRGQLVKVLACFRDNFAKAADFDGTKVGVTLLDREVDNVRDDRLLLGERQRDGAQSDGDE